MTATTKRPGPRFGIWAVVYGTSASLQHPDDPIDASWLRNRDLVLEAEALGIDSVLVAQHIINPFGDEFDQLETLTSCGALAPSRSATASCAPSSRASLSTLVAKSPSVLPFWWSR